jgi:hypothetical protein
VCVALGGSVGALSLDQVSVELVGAHEQLGKLLMIRDSNKRTYMRETVVKPGGVLVFVRWAWSRWGPTSSWASYWT